MMNALDDIDRLFRAGRSTAARAVVGLVWLLGLSTLCVSESTAMDIAILQSSDIPAYHEAIAGLKATGPIGAIYTEYDAQGDPDLVKKLARKLRASNTSLVVAVGLKAALAAKSEIVDVPIVYMMILDPLKHQLNGPNMTGTLLEVPVDRQLKIMRTFLPSLRHLGTLYDPAKTSSRVKEAVRQATINDFHLKGFPVENEKDVPQQLRTLLSDNIEALWLMPDSTVVTNESVRFILESSLAQSSTRDRVLTGVYTPGSAAQHVRQLRRCRPGNRTAREAHSRRGTAHAAQSRADRATQDHRQSQDREVPRHYVSEGTDESHR